MQRRRSRIDSLAILATVASLAGAPAAAAAPPPAAGVTRALLPERDRWIRVETAHYTLFSDAPETRTVDIGNSLERFRAVLTSFLPDLAGAPIRPTYVYVFGSGKDFLPYKLRREGAPTDHAGFFLARDVADYVTIEAPSEETALGIVYHESAHQLLHDRLPSAPLALGEGLAEYYATFKSDGRVAKIGLPIERHVSWLALHTPIPLRDLLSADARDDPYQAGDAMHTFYAESWALVHDLLRGNPERRPQLETFLRRLQGGEGLDDAFRGAFGTTYEDLLKEVRAYLARRRFPYQEVKFSEAFRVDLTVRVAPLGRGETLCSLGDLLAHIDPERSSEAEDHFREAIRIDPGSGCGHAGLGSLRYQAGRYAEAAPELERAVSLDPVDFTAGYLYGQTLLQLSQDEGSGAGGAGAGALVQRARAREVLARVVRLRPDFAAAYVALGAAHVFPDGEARVGIEMLEKARRMLPGRTDVVANLVYLYLRDGTRDKAQELVDTVLAKGGDPDRLEGARLALSEYDRMQEARRLQATAKPDDIGRSADWNRKLLDILQKALDDAPDPEARKRLEAQIEILKRSDRTDYNRQVAVFNKAVELANRRDYALAIGLLENLLPDVKDPDLARQVAEMLARFRKDAPAAKPGPR